MKIIRFAVPAAGRRGRRGRRLFLAFAIALPIAAPSMALRPWVERDPLDAGRPVTRRFEDVDGLPQNTVHAMVLDLDGYLWAGTQDGAAFYDGQTWTRVDLPNSGRSNFVRSMLQSRNGDLWIGSQAGGLARRRDGVWHVFEPGDSGLPDDRVNALLEVERADGGFDLWIATHEGGVVRFDGEDWTVYSTAAGLPSAQVWDLLASEADGGRKLWLATGAGPATLDLANGAIAVPAGAPKLSVSALHESTGTDGKRTIHVGTYGGGVWSYAAGRWTSAGLAEGMPGLFVTDFAPSPSRGPGAFWIATDGGGLALLDGETIRAIDLGATLSSRAIYRVLETTAEEGARALWLGTRNNGVIRLVDGYWRGFQPFPETPSVPVNALLTRAEADGTSSLWLGTDGYGIALRKDGVWKRIDTASGAIGNDSVTVIFESRAVLGRRLLWVGTRNGGLSMFDGAGWKRFSAAGGALPNDMVQALAEQIDGNGRGTLWVGTRAGLASFDGSSWSREAAGEAYPRGSILCLVAAALEGGRDEIWVGTTDGLFRGRSGAWSKWDARAGLTNPAVQSLHLEVDPSGKRTLWIGTDGGGALRLQPDDPAAAPRRLEEDGIELPNGSIYSILEDAERRVYILTNRGVTRLTRVGEGRAGVTLDQFNTEHGLALNQGNRGAGFVDPAGRIWFGTVGGAVAFDPEREVVDRTPKKLRLSAQRADCADCRLFDGQLLSHGQDRLIFRFTLLSFFAERLTRYRTELIGHDRVPGEWGRSGEREVSTLASGRYVFRVWGRDAAGNVAGPAELGFTIQPAPWETSWARSIAGLILLGLGFGLWRARGNAHLRRERALEEQVAARTRRLQRANALLVELSYVDALTAVPNRRRFDELLAEEWKRSGRAGSPLGLVVVDIDAFKAFNDSFGHQRGDDGLRQVASALADGLTRSGDTIARFGGEEFAVILPSTDEAGAQRVAEQLRQRVEALAIPQAPGSGRRFLTVSCGAVSIVARVEKDPGDLFRRADEAMYRAKRAGGNRTEIG